ncbi:MAG: hypothetical protein H6706_23905 [Myxococcales bacterium]|nr:hypothetical protein [Myxococcales bacterium]
MKTSWLLLGLCLVACDEGGGRQVDAGAAGLDVGRPDAGRDAGRPDGGIRDASPRDAARPDASRLLDAGRDRGVADARVVDAVVDAARDAVVDAGDAAVDAYQDLGPLDACVGFEPPPPVASPDGSEVCNYLDDDGDGHVDEGFAYDVLGPPIRVSVEPGLSLDGLQIAWVGDRYVVSWGSAPGQWSRILAPNGCPVGAARLDRPNPDAIILPSSSAMAVTADRYAVVFTQERIRPDGWWRGWGTFVQVYDLEGNPVGELIDIEPEVSHIGYVGNLIVAAGEQFAVFSPAYDPFEGGTGYSSFVLIDRDGHIVAGPGHPYDVPAGDRRSIGNVIGMAWDGEAFGLAWYGGGNWFIRFSPDGELLVPPTTTPGLGLRARHTDVVWNGAYFVIPNEAGGNRVRLAFLDREGREAPFSPVIIGGLQRDTLTYHLVLGGSELLHYAAYQVEGEDAREAMIWFNRFDLNGAAIAPRRRIRYDDYFYHFAWVEGQPLATLTRAESGRRRRLQDVWFRRYGCQPGGD